MGRSIKTVQQFEQVIEPYRLMFEELKGKNKQPSSLCSCKEKKNTKKTKNCFFLWGGGGGSLFMGFHSMWELGSTTSHKKLKSMRMSVNDGLQYNTA
jgi:hypothetical protein